MGEKSNDSERITYEEADHITHGCRLYRTTNRPSPFDKRGECGKDQETVQLLSYLSAEDAELKVFENQNVLLLPIVRNGEQATVGYQPDIWKTWE